MSEKHEEQVWVLAAIIGPARGLKGEVTIDLRTDRPDEVFVPGSTLSSRDNAAPVKGHIPPELTVIGARTHSERFMARFEEVSTREEAEALRGLELFVPATEEEDSWYAHDLIGLKAVDVEGRALGTVSGLSTGPAQDLLLVDHGGREVMVPFVEELVPTVDVEEGLVVLDPPLGLFDEEEVVEETSEELNAETN